MGGGGDVVGTLGITDLLEGLDTEWVLGGVAWERTPIDPRPGPRSLAEMRGGRPAGSAAVLTEGSTTTLDGVELSESKMATHLGKPVLLLDITRGPQVLATGLAEAAEELECDAVVLLDVGGDVLAHGDEPGLASPLAGAVLLAGAPPLRAAGLTGAGAGLGAGCDGELTPDEVGALLAEVAAAGGYLGTTVPSPA